MKKIFLGLALTLSFADAFACPAANPQKVVLFVDTNGSALEAEKAAQAACRRGDTFVILPAPVANIRRVRDAQVAFDRARTASFRCQTNCDAINRQVTAASASLTLARQSVPPMSAQILNTKLRELAGRNVAVRSIVASGHDGGGVIHGNNGEVNKYDIIRGMKSAYQGKPDLLRQWSSVLMWGCFTATPSESAVWRSEVPSLRALAGFDGIGPSNEREASRDVLADFLVKEHRICEARDQNELRNLVASVEDIQHTSAGMFLRQCNGAEYYYARRDSGTVFGRFNQVAGCAAVREVLTQYRNELAKYHEGTMEPPADGVDSPLRQMYTQLRQNAQCIPAGDTLLDPNNVGLMRFWGPYKRNVAQYFNPQTTQAVGELNRLEGVVDKVLEEVAGNSWWNRLLANFMDNPKANELMDFDSKLREVKARIRLPTSANIGSMTRGQIIRMTSELSKITNHPAVNANPKLKTAMKALLGTQKVMNRHFYEIEPRCTPFEDWHEHPPARALRLSC